MLYTIVQDIPGRLRLRCGRGIIGEAESDGIAEQLGAIAQVSSARVAPSNGSILVEYTPGASEARKKALALVSGLDVLALPQASGDAALGTAREDNRFAVSLLGMVVWRGLRRILLPPPARAAFAIASALPFVSRGLESLVRLRLDVSVLDATALVAALLQRNFDSASTVMFLLRVSELMQEHVNARTRIALEESLLVQAETVWAVDDDNNDVEVHLADVSEGMRLRVRTGQTFPVDGTVLEGDAEVNEASMTGESTPVHKHEGSPVFAGTVVGAGSLIVRADALPGASRISQIVRLVEESSELKAHLQSRAEHLADALVPLSFAGFFAVLALTRNLTKATSVLMVDYSCAIKLSTPVAVMSAMREASINDAVVKGGKYLEALAAADVVVFDKTGTLTTASPQVEKVIPWEKWTRPKCSRSRHAWKSIFRIALHALL